ncbi:hypothetical protein TNCT_84601 [Trichonephila clavata]|uniref:Uncharacterized protein n=1 Tax=Trichonephila clavata TaxID=2740835 RepID=A0A8X6FKC0_TRICU|nr:hypothetical protein TNCT_84601 [Trichonephila clavata]
MVSNEDKDNDATKDRKMKFMKEKKKGKEEHMILIGSTYVFFFYFRVKNQYFLQTLRGLFYRLVQMYSLYLKVSTSLPNVNSPNDYFERLMSLRAGHEIRTLKNPI